MHGRPGARGSTRSRINPEAAGAPQAPLIQRGLAVSFPLRISSRHFSTGRVSPLTLDGLVCGGGSRRRRDPAGGHHLPRSCRPGPPARPDRADDAAHRDACGDAFLPVPPDPRRQGRGSSAEFSGRPDRRLAQHADHRLGHDQSRGAFVKQTFGKDAADREGLVGAFCSPSFPLLVVCRPTRVDRRPDVHRRADAARSARSKARARNWPACRSPGWCSSATAPIRPTPR